MSTIDITLRDAVARTLEPSPELASFWWEVGAREASAPGAAGALSVAPIAAA